MEKKRGGGVLWDSEMKFEPSISRIIGLIPTSESTDIAAVQDSACADRLTRWPLDIAVGKSFVARDKISALGNLHSWMLHGAVLQMVE